MRILLTSLVLSSLLIMQAFPHVQAAAPHKKQAVTAAIRPPNKFGRWINRSTRPVGLLFQKVLPFRLAQKDKTLYMLHGCGRCFPADTRISLPGGITCAISELLIDQLVLGWNPATNALDTVRVEALATVVHDSLRQLSFADGRTVTATADHPFWVKNVGWASLAPALTTARYATNAVQLLHPGDSCLVFNGTSNLASTQLQKVTSLTTCGITTYTITRLSRGSLFFANGLAVGVEGDKSRSNCLSAFRLARLRHK